jgi:hypothetical protein
VNNDVEDETGKGRFDPRIIAVVLSALIIVILATSDFTGQKRHSAAITVGKTPLPIESAQAAKLAPIFEEAEACFTQCKGGGFGTSRSDQFKLPYKFPDLLGKAQFQAGFDSLMGNLPAEFAGLGYLVENDREGLEMAGSAEALLVTPGGRKIQIYGRVGYPDKQWADSTENRRPAGILTIAVDVANGEMAGIFNGPEDLSEFRFIGSETLRAPLLAYLVAEDFRLDNLTALGFPENAPILSFR